MADHGVQAEHVVFTQSCHSVEQAAKAARAKPEDFVKNICLIASDGRLIVAIVKGEDRVDLNRVAQILDTPKPRIATQKEILEKTGYPVGGTPSFGYSAVFLIDERVMEKDVAYSGGGSENALVKIMPLKLQKANQGQVVAIRK